MNTLLPSLHDLGQSDPGGLSRLFGKREFQRREVRVSKFGAGGLGTLLFDGIAQPGRYDKIWAGSIAVSALALVANWLLLAVERRFDPRVRIGRAERHRKAVAHQP